jgi:hypothetical protein
MFTQLMEIYNYLISALPSDINNHEHESVVINAFKNNLDNDYKQLIKFMSLREIHQAVLNSGQGKGISAALKLDFNILFYQILPREFSYISIQKLLMMDINQAQLKYEIDYDRLLDVNQAADKFFKKKKQPDTIKQTMYGDCDVDQQKTAIAKPKIIEKSTTLAECHARKRHFSSLLLFSANIKDETTERSAKRARYQ